MNYSEYTKGFNYGIYNAKEYAQGTHDVISGTVQSAVKIHNECFSSHWIRGYRDGYNSVMSKKLLPSS
jgi:hypothetical protein